MECSKGLLPCHGLSSAATTRRRLGGEDAHQDVCAEIKLGVLAAVERQPTATGSRDVEIATFALFETQSCCA